MRYKNVAIAGLGYAVPPKILSSAAIEDALAPVYERIGLHAGRLELMTGIKERRYWDSEVKPSDAAVLAARDALQKAGKNGQEVDVLIHASVCRDFLEPATASVVHEQLGLRAECQMFDLSNACLGVASSMAMAAQLIESGSIQSALVVAGEIGKPLVDATIAHLNSDESVTRKSIKSSFASLTIGSGASEEPCFSRTWSSRFVPMVSTMSRSFPPAEMRERDIPVRCARLSALSGVIRNGMRNCRLAECR